MNMDFLFKNHDSYLEDKYESQYPDKETENILARINLIGGFTIPESVLYGQSDYWDSDNEIPF